MWLLPVLAQLSTLAARGYYRLTIAGARVPRTGPVLLVANHPNSLLDPALVAAAADRPVRFLAKAPLFTDRQVGWLVRGVGAVPIYRAVDDPNRMEANADMFRAVWDALVAGAAIGIFPEGISHSEPSLTPLKTGAARIALGAAARRGAEFPIVPVGLVFRDKQRFRSEALVALGAAVEWSDLGTAGPDDGDAVRELTHRIEEALREVTINLDRWQDAPLVECAEAIYAAEWGAEPEPTQRMARLREATTALARLRSAPEAEHAALVRDVARHARTLRVLKLRPADLREETRLSSAIAWTMRQAAFLLLVAPLAAVGALLFWPPYRLTGVAEARASPDPDVRSTYKTLASAALFLAWIGALAALAALLLGWKAGFVALVLLLVLAPLTLAVRDRIADARATTERFLLLRLRPGLRRQLTERQREIAYRLRDLHRRIRQ